MYLHSSSGLGIFGMGVLLEEITPEERRTIDRWLYDADGKRADRQFHRQFHGQYQGRFHAAELTNSLPGRFN